MAKTLEELRVEAARVNAEKGGFSQITSSR